MHFKINDQMGIPGTKSYQMQVHDLICVSLGCPSCKKKYLKPPWQWFNGIEVVHVQYTVLSIECTGEETERTLKQRQNVKDQDWKMKEEGA